jgi:hypothetical protein
VLTDLVHVGQLLPPCAVLPPQLVGNGRVLDPGTLARARSGRLRSILPELEAAQWWQARTCGGLVDDEIGWKAGTGLRVVASVIRADGEEQGIGAWRRTGSDLGAWRLDLGGVGEGRRMDFIRNAGTAKTL